MSKIIFELVLQDVNAQQAIQKFRQEVKDANAEIKKGVGADRFKELTEKITAAKIETLKLTDEQKKLRKEFAATQVPTDSLAGLRIAYSQVTEQVRILSKAERESDFGKSLIKRGASLKSQVDGIEQSLGRFTGNVGNYKSAMLSIGDLITGGLATGGILAVINGVVSLGNRAIEVNAKVSDSVADVAKAANVSISVINELAEKLKLRDTRTSLLDQLGIAEIGGKLGVAEKDLLGFVEAVDVVNVALGDQFGGSVETTTEVIGKLRNVLLDIKTNDIGTDIVGIGNALNFLESQGAESAGTMADFAGRIGGVASPLGVSAGQILGVSATLDELAVNAERGSTAVVRILQRVAVAPDSFAKAIGVPAKEFKDLVNKDIFGAVQLVLQKLNDKNLSNTELQQTLKDLKINGVGVSEVVGKLGANLDLLKTRVNQSTTALGESSSVLQEFEKKNDTLAASIQKAKNAYDNFLTNSSNADAIGSTLDFLIEKVQIFERVAELAIGPSKRLFDSIKDFFSDDEKVGLNGLDVETLKQTIDLVTGELLPVVNKATEATNENTDATDKNTESKDKNKKEQALVNGSLAFFRDQIAALKKELENTPPDSPLFKKLIGNIREAETALANLEELVKTALDPSDIGTGIIPASGLTVPVTLEVVDEDKTAKQIEDFLKRINKKARENKAASDAEQAEIDAARREDLEEAIKEAALDTAQAISNGLFEIQRNRQEKEKSEALSALDAETAKKIEQAQGNAALITQIEKDADKKRAAIEKEAAQRAKSIALKQAAIDTALSILKALSSAVPPFNFILAGAAAVAGAIQLAVIKKQEFAGGGRVKKLSSGIINEKPNHPRTAKGDNVLALVKSGEMILNEEQQARLESIAGRGIYGRIGVPLHGVTSKLVPQFAGGGFATDFTPQIALPQGGAGQAIVVQTVAEISDEQMNMLAARIAAQTGRATKEGVGEGLEDNNRLQERQAALTKNREA